MEAKQFFKNERILHFLSLIIVLVYIPGCSPDHPVSEIPVPRSFSLPVLSVANQAIDTLYPTPGTVVSDARVEVTSRISGYIRNITVQEGQMVKKGELLVVLDNSDVEGAIRQAHAAVSLASAAHKDAATDAIRYEALFKKGSTSDNVLRKVRLLRDTTLEMEKQAKIALETAQAQRVYVTIMSPVDGVVVVKAKRNGDLAIPGQPIIVVESAANLLFQTYVAESQVRAMKRGDLVAVKIGVINETFTGKIVRLVPSGDPVTRRYLVKIHIPEQITLLPGMFGRASFVVGSEYDPVIPKSAMITRAGLKGVFLVRDDNSVNFRWLRTGREWPHMVQIHSGLTAGEIIVERGGVRLKNGDLVDGMETGNER